MQQWSDPFRSTHLLRHGERPAVLPFSRQYQPLSCTRRGTGYAGCVGVAALPFGHLRAIARFFDFRSGDFLHLNSRGIFCAALAEAGDASTVPGLWVSCAAGAVHRDGRLRRSANAALQTAVHLAGADYRVAGDSGLLALEIRAEPLGASLGAPMGNQ